MPELYDELAVLLAVYVDASMTLAFVADADTALHCAYVNVQGRSGVPEDPSVSPQSTAATVFATGVPVRYDTSQDWPSQRLYAVRGRRIAPESAIFVPIVFGGRRVGVLSVQSTSRNAYVESDVATLETCALYLGARIHDEQQRARVERFERLATVDVLTGVANRAALDQCLERELRRTRRSGTPMSLVMIDVDFFKPYNDAYGHVAGDAALVHVAGALGACLERPGDLLARYGGEEFAVVLPETNLDGAIKLAEAMRANVERLQIVHDGTSLGIVSISAGCASVEAEIDSDPLSLIRAADGALYDAKLQGRNRIAAAGYRGSPGTPVERRGKPRGNLPDARTRFFGREADIEKLAEAVRARRLVSIVGPGGVGKTRLALEVAGAAMPAFPDGVWFVDVAALADEAEITPFVCASLKGLVPPARDPADLIAALRERRVLLVLDNCEHVVDAVGALADRLIAELPELRILVTSREALGVEGEDLHRLGPLGVDEGAALFVDRARSAGVNPAELHAATVADVVEELDGIPLAIELAAPRLTIVSLEQLRARLGDRLTLLRSTSRRRPTRQQTLRATMDWSYRLLPEIDQTIFNRLSVFVGGWTIDAAATVCADDRIAEADVAASIESLVAKSLIVPYSGEGASRRFRMLETTREYAAEQLEASGEAPALVRRHADVFAAIALELGAQRRRISTTFWHRRVTEERGNFQAALRALLDGGELEPAAQAIVALVDWLWERSSVYAFDLIAPLQRALGADAPIDPAVAAALLLGLSCVRRRTDPRGYHESASAAFEYYDAHGPVRLAAAALRCVAWAGMVTVGGPDARFEAPLARYAAELERQSDFALAAELTNHLGQLYTQTMDDAQLPIALACFDRAIALYERGGDGDRCGVMYGNSADVAFYMGDASEALRRVRRAIGLLEQSEEPWQAAIQYLNLGHFATWAADYATARAALAKAFKGAQAYGGRYGEAGVYDKVARLALSTGETARAARLLSYADLEYLRDGSTRQRRENGYVDAMRLELQQALGVERYAAETAAGREFTAAQAEAEMNAVTAPRRLVDGINGEVSALR